MRDALDRLTPMLGFKVRVTERGGTSLGSLLSNKNLWSGVECGRGTCRTCVQLDERKELCTLRNVVYESECTLCNEPGSRKAKDKEGREVKKGWSTNELALRQRLNVMEDAAGNRLEGKVNQWTERGRKVHGAD